MEKHVEEQLILWLEPDYHQLIYLHEQFGFQQLTANTSLQINSGSQFGIMVGHFESA